MPGQGRDVLAPLPQGRHAHPDHVEAVEEVLPEPPVAYPLPEVLVGGRDDAHLDPHRSVPADPVELLVGEDPQQPRLELRRHVPDLVEEQGASVRLFEAPLVPRMRPREGAPLVAEELRFEQLGRDGRGVDRDEGPVRARAVLMEGPGDELLPGPRLAGDEHGHGRARKAADRPEHLLHGGGGADDPRLRALGLRCRRSRVGAARHRPLGHGHDLVDVERLGKELERSLPIRRHRAVEVGVRGHHHDGQFGMVFGELREEPQASGTRHSHVTEHRVRAPGAQGGERRVSGLERPHPESGPGKSSLQHEPNRAVVVDDPDLGIRASRHSGGPAMGRRMENVVSPGSRSYSMIPPWWLTSDWAMGNPSPEPSGCPLTIG